MKRYAEWGCMAPSRVRIACSGLGVLTEETGNMLEGPRGMITCELNNPVLALGR